MAQSNGGGAGGTGALPAELLADGRVVGAKVRVITQADEAFEGTIFTIDPVASFLFLGGTRSLFLRACECTPAHLVILLHRGARGGRQGQNAYLPDRSAHENRGAR